eukprot:scaffold11042_cov29-Prasinocladus_malaysianus.AAC.1
MLEDAEVVVPRNQHSQTPIRAQVSVLHIGYGKLTHLGHEVGDGGDGGHGLACDDNLTPTGCVRDGFGNLHDLQRAMNSNNSVI